MRKKTPFWNSDRISGAIDRQIEQAYTRHAQGRQINVLKIPALFKDVRTMIANGQDLNAAVQGAVATYCEPVPR